MNFFKSHEGEEEEWGPHEVHKIVLKKDELAGVIQQNFMKEVMFVMDCGAFWTVVV